MNEQVKHTETPLAVFIDDDGSVDVATVSHEYTGDQICHVDSGYKNDAITDEANAAHIVKCVNAHDGLVKALRFVYANGDADSSRVAKLMLRAHGIEVTP